MSLLTTNQLVFSVDSRSEPPMVTRLVTNIMLFRLSVSYDKNAENWGLVIQSAQERDSASYLCQVRNRSRVNDERSDPGPGGHVAVNWQAFSIMYLLEG